MKFATPVTNLNLRTKNNGDTYTAFAGRNTIAKNLELFGGVWKITLNNDSVDYYQNESGEVVYILTCDYSDTKKGLFFKDVEAEDLFLEQFANCQNSAIKMQELIRIIKENV